MSKIDLWLPIIFILLGLLLVSLAGTKKRISKIVEPTKTPDFIPTPIDPEVVEPEEKKSEDSTMVLEKIYSDFLTTVSSAFQGFHTDKGYWSRSWEVIKAEHHARLDERILKVAREAIYRKREFLQVLRDEAAFLDEVELTINEVLLKKEVTRGNLTEAQAKTIAKEMSLGLFKSLSNEFGQDSKPDREDSRKTDQGKITTTDRFRQRRTTDGDSSS